MKTTDLINDLRTALGDVKARGNTTIPLSGLETYLSEMEKIHNEDDSLVKQNTQREEAIQQFEYDMEVWKVKAPLENAAALKMFDSVIEAGQTAIKSATLINGGAAVALLAFLGNLLTKEPPLNVIFPIQELSLSMLIFFLGVGFSGSATAARYFSQAAYSDEKESCANFFRWVAIILALLSLGAFFYGGILAYCAITPS